MYCSNIICAEYSKYNLIRKYFCHKCLNEYLKFCKIIQAHINKNKIKNLLNPSNVLEKIYLTDDKRIIKYILKYGYGNLPQKQQELIVHYTGRLLNGNIFDSSKKIKPFKFILGNNEVIKMLELAFSSMKKGEKSIIIGHSEYGETDTSSIIPKNSSLHFELELIDINNKEKNISEMSNSEKLENILKYKNNGLIEFKNNNIKGSIFYFEKALNYLVPNNFEEEINILNNLSICNGTLNKWNISLKYSLKAYNISKDNIKVLYRLALAYFKLNDYDNCINICKISTKIEYNNMINSLFRNSINKKKKQNIYSKNLYKNMF